MPCRPQAARPRPALLVALLPVSLALAQAPPPTPAAAAPVEQLDDLVVTASRTERSAQTVPASVTVISAADIARSQAQTVPDLLRHGAGIDVSDWYGNGRFAGVDARGFGENANLNTLVLVDGRRLNREDANEVDWTTVPLERIECIEIVRGGNSVLYGDRAVGAVINIRTKRGAPRNRLSSETSGGSYGSFRQALGLAGSSGPFSYAANGSYADGDGYRDNSYFRNTASGLSLTYDAGGPFAADFAAGAKKDRYGMPGGRWPGQDPRETAAPDDYAETEAQYVQFTPRFRLGDRVEFSLATSYAETETYWIWGGWEGGAAIYDLALMPKLTVRAGLLGLEHEVTAGVDLRQSEFDDLYRVNRDMHRHDLGYYANDTVCLLPERLFLDLGYRRSHLAYGFDESAGQDGAYDVDSSRVGLTYAYARGSKLFASVDRSFRSVLLQELGGPGFNVLLPPQTSWQYQLGAKHSFGRYLTAGATAFVIETDGEIFYDPTVFQNTSYPRTRRTGVELEAESRPLDPVRLSATYTWLEPELRDGPHAGQQIPGVPMHAANAGLTWDILEPLALDLRARWIDDKLPFSDWANQSNGWAGDCYTVVDLKVNYHPREWLELYAGVNNLLDEEYAEYGGWFGAPYTYPSAGRNVVGGIRLTREF